MYQTGDTIELGGNYVVSVETTEIEREGSVWYFNRLKKQDQLDSLL